MRHPPLWMAMVIAYGCADDTAARDLRDADLSRDDAAVSGANADAAAPIEAGADLDTAVPSSLIDGATGSIDASGPTASSPEAGVLTALRACGEQCAQDNDCWSGQVGFESCKSGRCSALCESDDECTDKGTRARPECSSDGNCRPDEVCVRLAVGARCALRKTAGCSRFDWARLRTSVQRGEPVEVCLPNVRCSAEGCTMPCQRCGRGKPAPCDGDAGVCRCASDSDCATVLHAPHCEVATGRCGCAVDADCKDAKAPRCLADSRSCGCAADADCNAGALCRFGSCVPMCESAMSCPRVFTKTTLVCE